VRYEIFVNKNGR